jgi:hypothetical protein
MSEEIENLNQYTIGVDKMFGEEIRQVEEKITNPQQFTPSTTFEDPVRSFLSPEQEIVEQRILNYYTVIAEYFYKANALANLPRLQTKGFSSLVKGKTYYVRPESGPSGPNLNYQEYFSQKKVKYLGEIDGNSVFEYSPGGSQLEAETYPYQLFGPNSNFYLYENEFSGTTGSTGESPVASCKVSSPAERNLIKFVKYKASGEFTESQERSITAWFKIDTENEHEYNVTSIFFDQPIQTLTVSVDRNMELMVGDHIELSRKSGGNFNLFAKIVEVIDKKNFKLHLDIELIDYLTLTTPNWFTYSDMKAKKSWKRIFVSSMQDTKGFQVELRGNRHFVVTLNSNLYWFSFPYSDPGIDPARWYAVAVSISNLFKQLTLNVWRPQWDPQTNLPATTDLKLVLGNTVAIPRANRTTEIPLYILPSKTLITNVRVFSKSMETDKQPLILNQNIVKDSQWALVIDNALPQSKLPKVGYTR